MNASKLVGTLVIVSIKGVEVCFGIAEYLTTDGYFGVRQPGGRLDEFAVEFCTPDPT
jgi:hypothetical protein